MDLWGSFFLDILFSIIFLPICFVVIVSIRRSILNGSYINNISSRYILITGCDSGFGFELAKRLDLLGCHVIATCLTMEGQNRLKEIGSSRITTLSMDVTNSESVKTAEKRVRELLSSTGAPWGNVNNAGISSFAGFIEFETLGNMKQVFNVNLWGQVSVTKMFLPHLKQSKGRIVNVCSISGMIGSPTASAYSISKFAVSAFTDCIRLELSLWSISVHQIFPGFFLTDIVNQERALKEAQHFWDIASDEDKKPY